MADVYVKVGCSMKSNKGNYYKILEFLGNGANAFAYRCLCTSGSHRGIEFVLKLQYNLSTEIRRERFLRESAFLESCNHPAILHQYDSGTFVTARGSFPFIITDFMPTTLQKKFRDNTILFESKIRYTCQLLSAVSFLQSRNIVHRDIKPSNIFISNDNVMLGDFGLIKEVKISEEDDTVDDDILLIDETVMNIGYIAMAKNYRTPELVNYANHVDALRIESDVFQLGLVLAELFTGKNPLRPSDDLRASIVVDRVDRVEVPKNGRTIHDTICGMLELDYRDRISIGLALDNFTGIYIKM